MSTIGTNIRNARKALHMSQDSLAEAIGANRVTISKYENDAYLPSVPALERLAAALNTTAAQLSGSDTRTQDEIQDEAVQIREELRRNPNMRVLFSAASKATPEHLKATIAMLKALEPEDDAY